MSNETVGIIAIALFIAYMPSIFAAPMIWFGDRRPLKGSGVWQFLCFLCCTVSLFGLVMGPVSWLFWFAAWVFMAVSRSTISRNRMMLMMADAIAKRDGVEPPKPSRPLISSAFDLLDKDPRDRPPGYTPLEQRVSAAIERFEQALFRCPKPQKASVASRSDQQMRDQTIIGGIVAGVIVLGV